ncbi:NepR family anti-sigma factor [Paracoccus sp. p4-l81]|uniref:NepR family anti-sigma factor n=1 Tax=unclassified Paracoccus (in: a-proteobacteria) TaxID=2688777 RepID=UPI0035B7580C
MASPENYRVDCGTERGWCQLVPEATDQSGRIDMNNKREERKRAAVTRQIDENLRRVYEQDVEQAVPDKFLALLQQLREQPSGQE